MIGTLSLIEGDNRTGAISLAVGGATMAASIGLTRLWPEPEPFSPVVKPCAPCKEAQAHNVQGRTTEKKGATAWVVPSIAGDGVGLAAVGTF